MGGSERGEGVVPGTVHYRELRGWGALSRGGTRYCTLQEVEGVGGSERGGGGGTRYCTLQGAEGVGGSERGEGVVPGTIHYRERRGLGTLSGGWYQVLYITWSGGGGGL